MANPLITIGNELHGDVITREMTDEEYALYLQETADVIESEPTEP